LTEIRKERNEARDLVAKGINPNENKRAEKVRLKAELAAQLAEADQQKSMELTLLDLAGEWLRDGVARKESVAGGGFQRISLERKKRPKPLFSTLNVNVTHKKTPLIEWRFL
jgi:hypothetical protein